MRIIFFIDGLIAGGRERRLVELMKGIKSGGNIDFELVVMNREVHYQQVFDLGIKIHYLVRTTRKDTSVFRKFYTICKNYKPDIIHCWDSMTAIYSIPASRLLRIPLINGLVSDAPVKFSFKFRLRTQFAFLFSKVIIGNSKAGLQAYHVPMKKSKYIYNGFDFKRILNVQQPELVKMKFNITSGYVVLMVGEFGERKDYDSFIGAARIVCGRRKDISFVAVGDGKDFTRFVEKESRGLNGNLKLLGRQSDVESIINASDICVLTTNAKVHREGISNAILEYMALGKPVIASSGGGTDEIVEDSKTGYLITPFNPVQLAEKIETLVTHADLRNNFGAAGQERIKTGFSIDNMVKEYVAIYENVSKKRSQRN